MSQLPKELKDVVDFLGAELGFAIHRSLGKKFYNHVESLRRASKLSKTTKDYKRLLNLVGNFKPEDRFYLAHSYAVLLELMNCAEAAYRSVQIRKRADHPKSSDSEIEIVLTAHPTESRSAQLVKNSELMTGLLTRYFQDPSPGLQERVRGLIEKFWLESISKSEKPKVMDEAEYIYEITLHPKVLRYILSDDCPANVKLITWVGGDKDGHPFIDDKVMLASLSASRKKLLELINENLGQMAAKLQSPQVIIKPGQIKDPKLANKIRDLQKSLSDLNKVQKGDSKKVRTLIKKLQLIIKGFSSSYAMSYQVFLIEKLILKFPALVMPLEIREDASVVLEANKNKKLAIYKMLKAINDISDVDSAKDYARGLILSHTEHASDLEAGFNLLKKFRSLGKLPVVPLLESSDALINGPTIVQEYLKKAEHKQLYKISSRFEVMVGYSDSSKEFGSLPSRKKIRDAIRKLEKQIEELKLQPVFFHGSGGSVARGGGSVSEQVAWWPKSCRALPKMTIQGEMVQRTFSRTEALGAYLGHFQEKSLKKVSQDVKTSKLFNEFLKQIEDSYRSFVGDAEILGQAMQATPYHYLDQLKLGSRPSKRKPTSVSVDSLRAIPWVLCWTQTRILFPTWWGIGSAWQHMNEQQKKELKTFAKDSPLLGSYLKLLGFSLAKIDFAIWELYLNEFLDEKSAANIKKKFATELKHTKEALKFLTGESNPLWYKPWLAESIAMRAKYITPLNLLQIHSMKDKDGKLLRECVTGIACGMMTTG